VTERAAATAMMAMALLAVRRAAMELLLVVRLAAVVTPWACCHRERA
jgi:hypothetical protein